MKLEIVLGWDGICPSGCKWPELHLPQYSSLPIVLITAVAHLAQKMEIPRFEQRNVNARLAGTDVGDSFQGFVHELLLPEHPQLHRFPGGGKDGGIDLIETSDTCYVAECKVVGEDDYAQIEQRWKTVKAHLEDHLRDPSGPTKGQSQYGPWYSTDTPIAEYVFCVSAAFANEQQRRDFKTVIADYFHDLAKRRSHLSHLAALEVTVVDWNDLCDRLRKQPHSIFRWFPRTRPNGFVPLDEPLDVGTFRTYLNGGTLPYYSVSEHLFLAPPPGNITILDEESLLARFEDQAVMGLVINGKGGIGKSRLTLELGWKARRNGWTVMRVQTRLKSDALERLVEHLSPESPVLLLIDYIETQTDFFELVESLNLLNDTSVARIRYVAACRTGYYHQAVVATGRHLPVDLSPPPGDAAVEWFRGYRCQAVQRILAKAGIAATARHLTACHDLPILAVFLAYLHTSGRTEELADLLNEVEFGRWVARRVQLSFPALDVLRALALLVPLFPMTDAAVAKLQSKQLQPVFERLATDGWIERVTQAEPASSGEWVAAHDVLADQILSAYLRSIPHTAETFVAELFSLAAELGCLDSALIALQRIADTPPLNSVPWARLVDDAVVANETAWRKVRSALIRTTLLAVPDCIALLNRHKGLWEDAEHEIEFHNALGWFCRWLALADAAIDTAALKEDLTPWVLRAAPFAERSNYLLTWGLRLAPDALCDVALRWISTKPALFQTHYLLVAWLESGLSTDSVAASVQIWCQKFSTDTHLSFVAKAWLDAGGDKAVVQAAIQAWLGVHQTDAEASHVYKAWLDAKGSSELIREAIGCWLSTHKADTDADFVCKAWLIADGDKSLVEQPIQDWLGVHEAEPQASHVYKAWLDAGGKRNVVWSSLLRWLTRNRTTESAVYVTTFVAKQPDLPEASVRDALAWCSAFPTHEEVWWRITQLGPHLQNVNVMEDACATTETLLSKITASPDETNELTRGQVATLLNYLAEAARLHSSRMRDQVDELIMAWMRHPASFGRSPKPYLNIQRVGFARGVLLLLRSGELDFTRDRDSIRRFLEWLDEWDTFRKQQLRSTIEVYSTRYPAPELWGIVKFEELEV